MRIASLSALLVAPAIVFAQAPMSLTNKFNAELPGINQLLKQLQAKDALVKAEALIPSTKPVFDTTDVLKAQGSIDEFMGLTAIYRLCANTAIASGDWQKGKEYFQKGLDAAKESEAGFKKASAPLLEQWAKALADGDKFMSDNQARKKELEELVPKEKTEWQAIQDANKGKKLKPDELKAINEKGDKLGKDVTELQNLTAQFKAYQDQAARAKGVQDLLAQTNGAQAESVKKLTESLNKISDGITSQSKEIADYNEKHGKKKGKKVVEPLTGNKSWVNGVLLDHTNLTKFETAQAQAEFLNHLLVLDPGNEEASKALENIRQGKDPFAKEPAAKKPGKKAGVKK